MSQRFPMHTAAGHPVWFLEPYRTTIDLDDLKAHTSRICRYGGASKWELVRHLALCVMLARKVTSDRSRLAAVALHDLHEAYVGDVVSPMKQVLPEFSERIEGPWEKHVHEAFGVAFPLDPKTTKFVKAIDMRALVVELHGLSHEGRKYFQPPPSWAAETFITVRHMALSACWLIVAEVLPELPGELAVAPGPAARLHTVFVVAPTKEET